MFDGLSTHILHAIEPRRPCANWQRRFIPLEARPSHARRPVAAAVDFIGRCGADASRNSAAAHWSNPFPVSVDSLSGQRRISFRSIDVYRSGAQILEGFTATVLTDRYFYGFFCLRAMLFEAHCAAELRIEIPCAHWDTARRRNQKGHRAPMDAIVIQDG
jgi:hypothetical protein